MLVPGHLVVPCLAFGRRGSFKVAGENVVGEKIRTLQKNDASDGVLVS